MVEWAYGCAKVYEATEEYSAWWHYLASKGQFPYDRQEAVFSAGVGRFDALKQF